MCEILLKLIVSFISIGTPIGVATLLYYENNRRIDALEKKIEVLTGKSKEI